MKRVILVVFCCILIAGAASAQGLAFYGIGGGVGLVNVSQGFESSQSGFGLNARADLGDLTTNLRLVPEVNFWSVSEEFGFGDESFSWTWRDVAINANVQYVFDLEGTFQPFLGGGLGLHFITLSMTDSFMGETFSATGSTTEIGVNLIGGALLNLDGPVSPYGEFRYVLVSGINHLMIQAGIMYAL